MKVHSLLQLHTIPERVADSPELQRESGMFHTRYKAEIRLFSHIQYGSVEGLLREIQELGDVFVGMMSTRELRQAQYAAVSAVTLATRYAIQGGLSEEKAYRFSDETIRAVDEAKAAEEILSVCGQKILLLTEMVAQEKQKLRQPPHIRACMRYIQEHLHEKITASDAAKACGLSADYLSRLFKEETGLTLAKYIQSRRLDYARQLLLDGVDVQTICDKCGIRSQSHFISLFKGEYGMTPGEFCRFYR